MVSVERVRELYASGKSQAAIAVELGSDQPTISLLMRKHAIERRPRSTRTDITGERFGRLLVTKEAQPTFHSSSGIVKEVRRWESLCDCGSVVIMSQSHLRHIKNIGGTSSCGCYIVDHVTELGHSRRIHGEGEGGNASAEYMSWQSAKARCFNHNYRRYDIYGGRGITMCERWKNSYVAFLEDMGRRTSPKHSLDRFPDPNGNYEPGNCRWATQKEQVRNSSTTTWLTHDGRTQTFGEWALELGVPRQSFGRWIGKGMTIAEAIVYKTTLGRTGNGTGGYTGRWNK